MRGELPHSIAVVVEEMGLREGRPEDKPLLGTPAYLDLHVKIAKDWQRDLKQLRRLGF